MSPGERRLVVRVRGSRAREVARWIRALVPTAILLVGAGAPGACGRDERDDDDEAALVVDADAVPSPLALARVLADRTGGSWRA